MLEIRAITFQTIYPVWQEKLWPGRASPIEPVSAINEAGLIDASILQYPPHFWGAYREGKLVGVISHHPTGASRHRLRGLYVDPNHRGLKIGQSLVTKVLQETQALGGKELWAMIRQKNEGYFKKFGFETKLAVSTYEFGPHFIMSLILRSEKNE